MSDTAILIISISALFASMTFIFIYSLKSILNKANIDNSANILTLLNSVEEKLRTKIQSEEIVQITHPASDALIRKIQEQEFRIESLQKQVESYKSVSANVYLAWALPREDKAAYLLRLHNDTADTLYGISFSVDSKYQDFMKLFNEKDTCDPQGKINLFFVPGVWETNPQHGPTADRISFIEKWIENKVEPIEFTISYSLTPHSEKIEQKIFFTKENLTNNFRNSLRASKSNLTLLT